MRHPCLSCAVHTLGQSKDGPKCRGCDKRVEYAKFTATDDLERTTEWGRGMEENNSVEQKRCAYCGDTKRIHEIRRNKWGPTDTCNICANKKAMETRQKNKVAHPVPDKPSIPEKPKERAQPVVRNDNLLTLDFAGHEGVLVDLKKIAADDMRTVEMQTMFIIKSYSEHIKR